MPTVGGFLSHGREMKATVRLRKGPQKSQPLRAKLAEKLMGWEWVPAGRYLIGNRGWRPDWRFQPEKDLNDAFLLLDKLKPEDYAMGAERDGAFWCRVKVAGVVEEARNVSRPLAITLAVARALGIAVEGNNE